MKVLLMRFVEVLHSLMFCIKTRIIRDDQTPMGIAPQHWPDQCKAGFGV